MLRLATLFLERLYMVATAVSHGGIAWRITWEVLGIEVLVDKLFDVLPDQHFSVNIGQGVYWLHELDEVEWFSLVGGCEMLTGS